MHTQILSSKSRGDPIATNTKVRLPVHNFAIITKVTKKKKRGEGGGGKKHPAHKHTMQ